MKFEGNVDITSHTWISYNKKTTFQKETKQKFRILQTITRLYLFSVVEVININQQ